jgi:acetyltransferase-like isoleucine patch superfamily enzyme
MAPALAMALASACWAGRDLPHLGDFQGMAMSATAVLVFYAYAILTHRLYLSIAPLRAGSIATGSGQEFRYQVYILFYLVLFNTLIRCRFLPIPVMRLVYLALGARLGANTYSAGIIFDPALVTIGANSLMGESAILVPHVMERRTLAHYPISIGNNVIIGAHAVILAGVTIGDDVIVAANSVVAKGTCIPSGETWGGTPARRLRERRAIGPLSVNPAAPIPAPPAPRSARCSSPSPGRCNSR